MSTHLRLSFLLAIASLFLVIHTPAHSNAYRESGKVAKIGNSGVVVTPPRDWNRLDLKPGKFAEVWTLDGEQLNDVTFYGGVTSGQPIVRERNKKRDPLPKFRSDALLIEIPELLEGTYRAYKRIGSFTLTNSKPNQFLGQDGVHFSYDYTDQDGLPRKGEARAAIIAKKLYMVTFDAPRLHYFERTLPDYRALADSARMAK
jgi:hypothetical protein